MQIVLYKNLSENNVIGKNLTQIKTLECNFKNDVSIINPNLVLYYESALLGANYCYIPNFNRYYFIDEIIPITADRSIIKCKVDVLESFKDDIKSLTAIINKQETIADKFIDDGSWIVENKDFLQSYNFSNGFNDSGEFILITAGG